MTTAIQPNVMYHSPMIEVDRLTPFMPTIAGRSNPGSMGLPGQNTRGTGRARTLDLAWGLNPDVTRAADGEADIPAAAALQEKRRHPGRGKYRQKHPKMEPAPRIQRRVRPRRNEAKILRLFVNPVPPP